MAIDSDLLAQLRAHSRDQAAFEQLVQLFEAHSASVAAIETQQRFQALYHLSTALSALPDLESLYRQAIAQGTAQLGFDRLALYLLDAQRERLIGTYGIDRHGELRDEHAFSAPLAQLDWQQAVHDAPEQVHVATNVPLYDWHEEIGTGWRMIIALRNGDQTLGYLMSDNAIHQRALRAHDHVLFSLYGSFLAQLIGSLRTKAELRHLRTLHQTTESLADIGTWELDLERMQPYWSEQIYRLHGVPIGQQPDLERALRFYPPESRLIIVAALEAAQRDGVSWDVEVPFVNAQGERLWVRVVGKALRDENGVVKRLYGFFQDLTAQRKAQQQALDLAIEREKVSALQSFLHDISHDFRTPFTTQQNAVYIINHYIQKLSEQLAALRRYAADRLPLQAQATLTACAELIQQIAHQGDVLKSSIKRTVKLVEQLLDMAHADRLSDLERAPCDLNALLAQILATYQPLMAEKTLKLTFAPARALPSVSVNANLLSRAVHNLLDNAMQYTPSGGNISVRTAQDAQRVLIEVTDDGIGIPEEALPHIFKRFYRVDRASHSSGSGLGLAIVKQVIEAHGGTVSVRSQLQRGTTFTLSLPYQPEVSGNIGITSSASESR